jgi:hypothetical protein
MGLQCRDHVDDIVVVDVGVGVTKNFKPKKGREKERGILGAKIVSS